MFLNISKIPEESTCVGDTFQLSCNPEDPSRKRLSKENFAITKWFCRVTYFLKDNVIIKKLFYDVV